jgi:integrase
MGIYIRGIRFYFKKQIEGKVYYRALNLKRGQESLLSARLRQVEEEVIAQHYGLEYQRPDQIHLSDYIDRYEEQKSYKKTISLDRQRLDKVVKVWSDPLLSQVSKSHINKLDAFLSKKVKRSTVNRYFEVIRNLFNLAIEDGYLRENPVRYYKPYVEEGERRALSREELSRILEAAAQIQESPRSLLQEIIHDLIVLALNTGMRLSEILNLKKSYIREDVIFYPITETKHRRRGGGNNKVKVICLNSVASAIIQRQRGQGEFVFRVEWRDPKAIRRTIAKIRKLSSISDFTFHQIRHTVSTFLSSHVSLTTARVMLGHSSIRTTLRYSHPELEEQRRGVEKIETFFREISDK